MSDRPPNAVWLEQALESTRRRVRQVEIDAYRIRTDLAQIEVANAAGIVDGDIAAPCREELSDTSQESDTLQEATLGAEGLAPLPKAPVIDDPVKTAISDVGFDWQSAATPLPEEMNILVRAPAARNVSADVESPNHADANLVPKTPIPTVLVGRSRRIYRRATSPVMASLVVHCAIFFLAASITVATFDRIDPQFAPAVLDLGQVPPQKAETIDPHQLADLGETGIHEALADLPKFDAIAALDPPTTPIDFQSIDGPLSLGRVGVPDAIPTDLGTLMTGGGGVSADGHGAPTGLGHGNQIGGGGSGTDAKSAHSGRAGNRLDSAFFFGTKAKGSRFVFIVDDSSSMKGGRLEMAVAELIRTVDSLSARQSFYVIFVSDQTYPMFYPQQEPTLVPATTANKKRLAEWAPKAILASGKYRELIKAMDLAAALRPEAVYLLWDGDLRYSEKVRLDVLRHLTQPNNGWNFIVHTLGMGIKSLDSEQNLRVIAQAHGGLYRRIDIPKGRTR